MVNEMRLHITNKTFTKYINCFLILVVKVTVILGDIEDYAAMNNVYESCIATDPFVNDFLFTHSFFSIHRFQWKFTGPIRIYGYTSSSS